jgi:hypothetical protein
MGNLERRIARLEAQSPGEPLIVRRKITFFDEEPLTAEEIAALEAQEARLLSEVKGSVLVMRWGREVAQRLKEVSKKNRSKAAYKS